MTKYSAETKAAALASLLEGQAIGKVAEEYNIPAGTVRSWKSREINGGNVVTVAKKADQKKEQIGDLLLDYLSTALATLQTKAEFFGDTKWLAKQNAADVAVLHGVITDKAIRLLEALSADGTQD